MLVFRVGAQTILGGDICTSRGLKLDGGDNIEAGDSSDVLGTATLTDEVESIPELQVGGVTIITVIILP